MTYTLSLGPLSLLATQTGPLLTITIHAPSDSAPVGKMTLTVPEWTALVAMVDSLAVADREMGRLKEENGSLREFIAASEECAKANYLLEIHEENERYRTAFRQIVEKNAAGKHTIRNAFCSWCSEVWPHLEGDTVEATREYARRHAFVCKSHPMRIERDAALADRDSLRQQVRELTEENERLKRAGDNPAGRIADLEWDRSQLRSDLSAALVSVDAMAERLKVVSEENERLKALSRSIHQTAWEAGASHERARLQPIASVLGDTASEQGKESK